jgi:hypothetical protein
MHGRVGRWDVRGVAALGAAVVLAAGCSGSSDRADDPDPTTVASNVTEPTASTITDDATAEPGTVPADATVGSLFELVPDDTRAVFSIDVAALSAEPTLDLVTLLRGEGADPAVAEVLAAVGALASSVDPGAITSALVGQTTDAAEGLFLLAEVDGATPTDVTLGTDGVASTILPGGVLVAGTEAMIASALDATGDSPVTPYLAALPGEHHVELAVGMPAVFRDVEPDRSLRGAMAITGALDLLADGSVEGELAFHTSNAADVVATYNTLDRHAQQSTPPTAQPLALGDPVVGDLARVVVPVGGDAATSRNLFKKLFVGMEAHDYAEDVFNPGNRAWYDFLVQSEADGGEPPSPGSVYIRWEFRDLDAVRAFEANELPAGFRIAPTRFLESDPPEGGYFLALNLYNGGGGMIVGGARAEWDVFVHGPDGADPNAGVRPRFMVVEVAAEEVSANSGDLLTPAEPVSHQLVDGVVVSSVRRIDGTEPLFESAFPVPDPTTSEVARFTREMAIGNDYIYWAHGVSDRVLYNATTFNHDAYFVDPAQITFTHNTRWTQYLEPEVSDAVYYVNTLEYVASPMANLVTSDHLDITPEWRDELIGFVNNGHQVGLMRKAVELLFRGQADALVEERVSNETPTTYHHFEITDPAALEAALDLPEDHRLAPITLLDGGEPGHYLTLSVYELDGAIEGTRAEWSVYTDDGDGRPPSMMILDLMTEDVAFDPVSVLELPSGVSHELDGSVLTTRLASRAITFEASFDTAGVAREPLSLDWIEAGDEVCRLNDICDKVYYDAETLDVPVGVAPVDAVTVAAISTPWDAFISPAPVLTFFRDNPQALVVKRWENLAVPVDELPFTGLDGSTHTISGSGSLTGRAGDIADSTYTYTGDAVLDGDTFTFAIDQQVNNALGEGNIYTTGSFDLASGQGTQTVVDCQGPALLCSGIVIGSTAFYTAQDLDASDPDSITWQVDVAVDLGGTFGIADSESQFTAQRL